MSFNKTRSDGKEVEIVSIDRNTTDYYQWGKNCANLEHTIEETRKVLSSYGEHFTAEQSDDFWRGFSDHQVQTPITLQGDVPMNTQTGSIGNEVAASIIANVGDTTHQLHGSAKCFKHHANLFRQFDAAQVPFMLLKVMATPQRNCTVPAQAEFFETKEELEAKYLSYKGKEVRENGLDVLFVDMFEWDLGINYLPPIDPN